MLILNTFKIFDFLGFWGFGFKHSISQEQGVAKGHAQRVEAIDLARTCPPDPGKGGLDSLERGGNQGGRYIERPKPTPLAEVH